MVILPLVLGVLLVGVIVALVIVPLLFRELRTMRRAGMSQHAAVCASCHYPLGGWSSSRCPECGADCESDGVRVGLSTIRPVRYGLMIATFLLGAPVCFVVIALLLHESYRSLSAIGEPESRPGWTVSVEVEDAWRGDPARRDRTITVALSRRGGASPPPIRTDDVDDAAFIASLDAAVAQVIGGAASPDRPDALTPDAARAAINRIIRGTAELDTPPDSGAHSQLFLDEQWVILGGGSGSGSRVTLINYVVFGAVMIVLLWCCIPLARRLGSDGVRPPHANEWVAVRDA